jgi:hypothetical protein
VLLPPGGPAWDIEWSGRRLTASLAGTSLLFSSLFVLRFGSNGEGIGAWISRPS